MHIPFHTHIVKLFVAVGNSVSHYILLLIFGKAHLLNGHRQKVVRCCYCSVKSITLA